METKVPQTAHAEIATRYESGDSLAVIAAAYGVSRQRIHQILVRLGVQRRPRGRAA